MAKPTTVISRDFDGTFYRVQTTSFDIQYIIGGGEDPEQVDSVDAEIRLPGGSRWSATIFTVAAVQQLMARWAQTGEHGAGTHFWCHDGLIVREPGVGFMTKVLITLHDDEDLLTEVFKPLEQN